MDTTTISDLADLKKKLEEKSTAELQHSIRYNNLTEQASAIACTILAERGAPIPDSISEEILEDRYKKARSNSNRSFLLTIVVLGTWAVYGYLTGLFELGDQERLNRSMLITFLSIASIWGWGVLGRKK